MGPQEITSMSYRIFILMIGLIETLLFSGVLFGWADLVYLMKLEGVFSTKCHLILNGNSTVDCHQQDNFFDGAFVLATFSKSSTFILVACLLDNFGLRMSRIVAIFQVAAGGLMIGYSAAGYPYLLYPGTLLVGLGGSQVRMNSFMIANLFPNHKSTVLSFYNGAFCASAALFLLFKYIHNLGIDVQVSFTVWSGSSVLMLLPTIFLLPSKSIEEQDIKELGVISGHQTSKEYTSQVTEEDANSKEIKGYGTISHLNSQVQSIPVKQSFFSVGYVAHLYWSCVSALLLAVYAGSFNRWVERITRDHDSVSKMMELYGYCQLSMILVPPLCGFLLDYSLNKAKKESDPELQRKKASLSRFWFLLITTLAQIVQLILMSFDKILMVQLSLLTFIFTRPMINAATVVHLRVSFPSDHFNILLGLVGTLSALFSSALQYPFFLWATTDQFAANMAVMVMIVFSLSNPVISLIRPSSFA